MDINPFSDLPWETDFYIRNATLYRHLMAMFVLGDLTWGIPADYWFR